MLDREATPLARTIRTLMRPLARLALRRGMAYGEMAEIVKQAYVDVASRELTVPGRRPSISRIAILTGLTRKEASRIVSQGADGAARDDRRRVNRAARVLSGWVTDSNFHDNRGGPASLAFESSLGADFSELVRRHGGDVPPRAVLDELLRVRAIKRLKDGRIRPVERAYVPSVGDGEKLAMLGTDVADLISTIDHNLSEVTEMPFFQRKVAYDNLPAKFLPVLTELVRTHGQKLLERLDAAMAKQDRDVTPDTEPGGHRAMIGIYYYEEDHHAAK